MLWTVWYFWLVGARFTFNCYENWAQLLLRQSGETPVKILIREGVTQGDPLLMVLYGITPTPLAEESGAADLGLLSLFYTNYAAFDGLAQQSAQLLKLLMKRGLDWGYFSDPAKLLFILDKPGQEESARREFVADGL